MDAPSPVTLAIEDRIATLTLNLPDKRNPISDAATVDAVLAAIASVAEASDVGALIVTGAGSAFSAGGDINAMRERTGLFAGSPLTVAEGYRTGIQRIPLALYELDVPSIAAVNGPAIGGGFDLAMACDIRIAAQTAIFAESFVNLGLISGDGGTWLLVRRLGYQLAADLTLTGRRVEADEALRLGIVTRVVAPDELRAQARALAGEIAAKPIHATRLAKRLLRHADGMALRDYLSIAAGFQTMSHFTDDHHEAVTAFTERREPRFSGK